MLWIRGWGEQHGQNCKVNRNHRAKALRRSGRASILCRRSVTRCSCRMARLTGRRGVCKEPGATLRVRSSRARLWPRNVSAHRSLPGLSRLGCRLLDRFSASRSLRAAIAAAAVAFMVEASTTSNRQTTGKRKNQKKNQKKPEKIK